MNTRSSLNELQVPGTLAWSAGDGDFLIIVHGGPGLDHSYLVDWLLPLAAQRTLVFYDQLGCGADTTPIGAVTADAAAKQLMNLVRNLRRVGRSVGVLTHSWGAYLAYACLRSHQRCFDEVILVSPVGLTRERFEQSGSRLLARIPDDTMATIAAFEQAGDGVGLMKTALPYYLSNRAAANAINFESYSNDVYNRVVETLGDYDFCSIAGWLPPSTVALYGELDIEMPADTAELALNRVEMVEGAGHFLFAERPEEFLRIVQDIVQS